ncbi:hypothetical protein Tco_1294170 [Tanacetum coccineum]
MPHSENVLHCVFEAGDNPIVSLSSNKHWILVVDQINHQSLGEDNDSSPSAYSIPGIAPKTLSFQKELIDRVLVLQVQHQASNRFEIPLVESVEDPTNLQEILQENLERLGSSCASCVRRIEMQGIVNVVIGGIRYGVCRQSGEERGTMLGVNLAGSGDRELKKMYSCSRVI